ncbi:MAG: type III pantothenate kinase [Clostridia bacterium]|nr:type III pantothenate kinase [Clostridia bacterium]
MLLVLDIGNTNIKTGIFKDGKLINSWRLTTDLRRTSDEYGVQMESFFNHLQIDTREITSIVMSSVIPSVNYTIEHMCSLHFHGIIPAVVNSSIKTGLINCYDNPDKMGSDRICNSVAAYHIYGGPCIVIDFGTATTFNVVTEKGELLGGLIFPGMKVAAEALTSSAALLPKIEFVKPSHVIASNTTDAIQSGIINGYVGMIEHIVDLINKEQGVKHIVVATGGMSNMLANESRAVDFIAPTLTLQGLSIIAKMNGMQN